MKNLRLMIFAVAATALSGCAKDDEYQATEHYHQTEIHLTVSASTTRTTINNEYKTLWSAGDRIGLFYDTSEVQAEWNVYGNSYAKNGTYQNLPYELNTDADGAAYGTFAITTINTGSTNEHPAMPYTGNFYWQTSAQEATFYACYPHAIYYNDYKGKIWRQHSYKEFPFLLPQAQGGTLDDVAALDLSCGSATVARGSETYVEADLNFRLKHLLAMLEFTVRNDTGSELTVQKLRYESSSNIAGLLEVNMTVPEVASASDATITATLAQPAVLADGESVKIYIMAAPADCTDGKITLTTSAGNHTFTGGTTFEAGKYYTKTLSVSDSGSQTQTVTIDFEDAELKSVTYTGYIASATYSNVLEGKSLATRVDDEDSWFDDTMLFDGILYERHGVGIGSMYNDGEWMYYGVNDNWSGIALSSNCDTETSSAANQFSVFKSDNGTNKFAVCYDAPSTGMGGMGLKYDTPTIVFKNRATVKSIDFMNAAYTILEIKRYDPKAVFVLKITGYNGSSATGSINLTLYDNGQMPEEWVTTNLSSLGEVDRLTLQIDTEKTTSKVQKPVQWMPFYFCIDNIVAEPAR